jgi:hypothetical protein
MPAARFTFTPGGGGLGCISVQIEGLKKGTIVPDSTFLLTSKVFLKTLFPISKCIILSLLNRPEKLEKT